jgi:small-conductance mechanosensitive channel
MDMASLLDSSYLGNAADRWLTAGIVFVGLFGVLLVVRRIVQLQYQRMAATPKVELLELPSMVASRTTVLFLFVASLYAASHFLVLPPRVQKIALTLFTIAAFWQTGAWASAAVLAFIERKRHRALSSDRAVAGTFGIITFLARATIWSLVLLLTLDNLGVQIKPLLAGLGIGGIAVALAVQNVLGDLFASLSIALDRPFVVGDTLWVDNFIGTVEYIGIKSTRLRSVDGEQIVIPNANLLNSRLRNLTRMTERHVVFTLSVALATSREQLARIPGLIRQLIDSYPDVRCERAHLARITGSAYEIEAEYRVTTADFNRHMDIVQDLQLRLLEALEKEGITIVQTAQSSPTRTVR